MAERFQLGYSPRRAPGHRRRAPQVRRSRARRGGHHAARPPRPGRPHGRAPDLHALRSRGRPIAFAGRRLPPDESARSTSTAREPALAQERHALRPAPRAHGDRASAEEAIVVEGYTDVIGLVQAGYENVVASMGTALTQPQLGELRKLARNVVLLFDADRPAATPRCAGSSSREPPRSTARARRAAAARLRSRRGRRRGPRGGRPHARRRAQRAGVPRRARARRRRRQQRRGAHAAYEALRAVLRDAPATPERDELVRLAASRLRLSSDPPPPRARARPRAAAPRRPRSRRRACPWTPCSATSAAAGAGARERRARPRGARARAPGGAHARGAADGARLGAGATEPGRRAVRT